MLTILIDFADSERQGRLQRAGLEGMGTGMGVGVGVGMGMLVHNAGHQAHQRHRWRPIRLW